MTAQLADALNRLASVTSVIRTRSEDSVRTKFSGGSSEALTHRVEEAVERLENVAAKLEATI